MYGFQFTQLVLLFIIIVFEGRLSETAVVVFVVERRRMGDGRGILELVRTVNLLRFKAFKQQQSEQRISCH